MRSAVLLQRSDLLLSFFEEIVMATNRRVTPIVHKTTLELVVGSAFLVAGIGLATIADYDLQASGALIRLGLYLSGLCFVASSGFLTAYLVASSRLRGPRSTKQVVQRRTSRKVPKAVAALRDFCLEIWAKIQRVAWRDDWLPVAIATILSAAALYALWRGWKLSPVEPGLVFDEISGIAMLVTAFPLLVLERNYAGIPEGVFPEAAQLARLTRVPLLGLVGLALAAGLRWLGLGYAETCEHVIAVITGLVALEIVVRGLVYIFVPLPPQSKRISHVDSAVAGLIRARLPNLKALNASVRREFGIDLARSWALGFIRRALMSLLLGSILFVWLLTGVSVLGFDQRAVYQSFGRPVAVLHSGIHLHLPWPFGVLRPVDYGTVREIPIVFSTSGTRTDTAMSKEPIDDSIEAEPSPAADRLWDDSTEQEGSYLVASLSSGRQSFEVADIDISVAYRIGLSDEAAEQNVYNTVSPAETIQALSGGILARYFARSTIADVLGQNRQSFANRFQKDLQTQLNALSSGVEVMAVIVEGVHPPPQAASSYQGVQAATIQSATQVSLARAEEEREMKMAAVVSQSTINDAQAAAGERIGQAKTALIQFDGDQKAYAAGGPSFLFERRLDRLYKGLIDKSLFIIDHRITPAAAPTLDMRYSGQRSGSNQIPSDD
jgi:regulator of protease activity HflC (stomatin/prohibitin superfamily)